MADKTAIVTIVGRQNVGKSTLFNSLIKKKKAIVDPFPGLTRDIIAYTINYGSRTFKLSDTPGLDLPDSSELSKSILDNAREYLKRSSVIILLMENPAPAPYDMDLADFIRKLSIPTLAVINKIDDNSKMENIINFYETGFNDIIPVSALNRFNLDLLLDKITELLPEGKTRINEPQLNISIVGRPNSGKSTLLNSFAGYNRSVVSDIPGTTRDAVDEEFNFQGKRIRVIDTAGIRKKSKIKDDIEYYSLNRTIKAIKLSDVAIHLIDAEIGLSDTDKKISHEIIKAKKPIIIAINKWDSLNKNSRTFDEFKDRLIFNFYKAEDFPIISISAKNKIRIHKLLKSALDLKERANKKISTPELNRIVSELQRPGNIPQLGSKLKVYYAIQINTIPPQFKFFVNDAELFRKDIIRYFAKNLQAKLDLKGIPIVIHIEGKKKGRK